MSEPTSDLEAERAHLVRSREALTAMRAQTRDWRTVTGANHVSTQYLKQMLFRRAESLVDDPTVPLFFGRIDYSEHLGAERDEVIHVGRRHVSADLGEDPLVMDWRAPMALPFYRASSVDPMHCSLRRRFGFRDGEITAFEDESLTAPSTGPSQILTDEIERPRTGPMRDIVATIQPDQDVLVRTDLEQSMAIQGAPGTGKTAVGLHRAAYLLYAFRTQLSRAGVLVVGPNASFLSYIGDVLPALGEIDADQQTVQSLVEASSGLVVNQPDDAARGVLLGDARMAEVLRRAVWGHVSEPTEVLAVKAGHRVLRVPPHLLADAVRGVVSRGVRYEAGRVMLPQRMAHQVLLRLELAGEATDDRVQNQVARSPEVKALAKQLWPPLKAPTLVHRLLSDPAFLAANADGVLTAEEQLALGDTAPKKSPASRRWTLAELVLVDEVTDLLQRTPSLGHVIVDEAQDLSPMMLRAVGRRATTGSVTLLGDLAQATTPWGARSWDESLTHLGHPEATVNELVEGFRVPGDVIDYAARLLPAIAPGLTPPRSIRHARGELDFRRVDDLVPALAAAVTEVSAREGMIGIVVPDALVDAVAQQLGVPHVVVGRDDQPLPDGTDDEQARRVPVELVPASLAKGLEFDHVVLAEPAAIVAGEADELTGLRRLYVCLTRAVTSLTIVHADDLPPQLG
ncbi:HelD family protein [Aestuariimicrobium soli]|uniref:HelD family protein n=1 Tax=Aestuariimicrobium soli TaxID=2035834 RepID=UPI003EBD5011